MNRRAFLIAVLALGLAACEQQATRNPLAPDTRLTVENRDGSSHDFTIEIVVSDADIERGLMFRAALDPDAGMLFHFGAREIEAAFWMKDTLIPLDLIFVRADGTVSRIHEDARPNDLTEILSEGPIAAVLEINAGRTRELGIGVGSRLRHPLFGNR